MAPASTVDLDAELDRLFQLPLDEFVQARNDLASRVRAEGRASDALRVAATPKPSVSVWAVNQLYWKARPEYDALMKAGQVLRSAQQAKLRGRAAELRDADKDRDAALVGALKRTLELLREAGHPASPAMRLRIATNLEALAAYGGTPPEAAPGRMSGDLEAPGFEVFEALAPARAKGRPAAAGRAGKRASKRSTGKVVSFEGIANARRELAEAEKKALELREAAIRAGDALEAARAEVTEASAQAERAKAAWNEAVRRVERAERDVPLREREAERAKAAAEAAAREVDRAREELEAKSRG